jgi:hypothetical protein
LAGTVDAEWTLDSSAAAVLREGLVDRRRIVGLAPGQTRLTVRVSTATVILPLRVLAVSGTPETQPEPEAEALTEPGEPGGQP